MPKPLIDCMFCGAQKVPSSGEDVFPIWLQNKLRYYAEQHHPGILPEYTNYTYDNLGAFQHDIQAGDFGPSATDQDVTGARPGGYIQPAVCVTCNGGWMGRLEQAAQKLMPGYIEGKSKTLAPFDQLILSTWMIKTCLTYDVSRQPRHIPEAVGSRHFFQLGYPMRTSSVAIAHDEPHTMEGALLHGRARVESSALDADTVFMAFQFDRLILQACIYLGDDLSNEALFAVPDDAPYIEHIWPHQGAFLWPSEAARARGASSGTAHPTDPPVPEAP